VLHTEPSNVSLPASTGRSPYSVNEVEFERLKDGTTLELVEDRVDPERTVLAVWKEGRVQFVDRYEQDGRIFVPLRRDSLILKSIRLANSVKPYRSVQKLLDSLECLIVNCVAVDGNYVPLLADFILASWFVDRFLVAPCLAVVGLPQSGKTTLLKALSLVCRRSLLISNINSGSLYQICTQFQPTILIDETKTITNSRALQHLLRSGTTRDVVAIKNGRIFNSYGAKVVSWLEPPDDPALNSRCILIPMFESKSTNLRSTDEKDVQAFAANLRAQLLSYRFEKYMSVMPAPVPGDEVLRPRSRDLLRALSAAHSNADRSKATLRLFQSGQAVPSEPLNPEQNAVLRSLFAIVHTPRVSPVFTKNLTAEVNKSLELTGERLHLTPRKVGAILTSFGFNKRVRTNAGWVLYLSEEHSEKLHDLAQNYGIEGWQSGVFNSSTKGCTLCQSRALIE
jgi:hypothetical protein